MFYCRYKGLSKDSSDLNITSLKLIPLRSVNRYDYILIRKKRTCTMYISKTYLPSSNSTLIVKIPHALLNGFILSNATNPLVISTFYHSLLFVSLSFQHIRLEARRLSGKSFWLPNRGPGFDSW